MAFRDKEKQRAYRKKFEAEHKEQRRKYFREYNRRNKVRIKMMTMLDGIDKIMVSSKKLSDSIEDKVQMMRKEQDRLDRKMKQIKNFLNLE